MSKRVSLTIVCVLLLVMLAGCDDNKNNSNNTTQNPTETVTETVTATPEGQPTPSDIALPSESPSETALPSESPSETPTSALLGNDTNPTPSVETTPTPTEAPKDLLHVCGGTVVLGDLGKLTLPEDTSNVTDEDVEKELQDTLASVLSAYPNYKRDDSRDGTEVKDGDTVNIDFVGKLDGVAFEGGTATDYDLTIGSNQFISDFEQGLIGKKVGTTVDINATFPEDYGSEEDGTDKLRGKTVVFTITINFAKTKKEEADDEYIKEVSGGAYESIDAYRVELKKMMIDEAKSEYENSLYRSVIEQMVTNSEFSQILDEDIAYYEKDMLDYYKSYAAYYSSTLEEMYAMFGYETYDDFLEYIHKGATEYVKEYMVLQEVAKAHGVTVTDEEYKKRVADYMESSNYTDQELFESTYPVDYLKYCMENDMALELLIEKARANGTSSGQ